MSKMKKYLVERKVEYIDMNINQNEVKDRQALNYELSVKKVKSKTNTQEDQEKQDPKSHIAFYGYGKDEDDFEET